MTVGELRALLSGFADDVRVIVDGYEEGADDPHFFAVRAILNAYNDASYAGTHELSPTQFKPGVVVDHCVLLSRSAFDGRG